MIISEIQELSNFDGFEQNKLAESLFMWRVENFQKLEAGRELRSKKGEPPSQLYNIRVRPFGHQIRNVIDPSLLQRLELSELEHFPRPEA